MQNTNIKEELFKLIDLQAIDVQIYALKKEEGEKPRLIQELEKSFDQKKAAVKECDEKTKAITVKRKTREGDLAQKEEQIKQLQAKLFALKTNKEYTAMMSEINGVKMDKSLIEEDILRLFDEQDLVSVELAKQQVILKTEEKTFNEEKQKLQNQIKDIQAKIAELEGRRSVAEKLVDQKILSQYNRILKGKEGLALVKITDNSCQGCHMNVPPQVINEIRMYDHLIVCETCSRILYVDNGTAS